MVLRELTEIFTRQAIVFRVEAEDLQRRKIELQNQQLDLSRRTAALHNRTVVWQQTSAPVRQALHDRQVARQLPEPPVVRRVLVLRNRRVQYR